MKIKAEVKTEALSLVESKTELYQLFKFICVDDIWELLNLGDDVVDQMIELANAPITCQENRSELMSLSCSATDAIDSLIRWRDTHGERIQNAILSIIEQSEHGEDEQARSFGEKRSWLEGKKTNIYMMLDEHTGLVKIGRSVNPPNREKTLQGQIPLLRMIWSCEGTHDEETQLHGIFSELRVRGEWFKLSKDDIKHVKSLDWRK